MINKAAVIGAGLMGSGIARHLCAQGVDVVLIDNDPQQLALASGQSENQGIQLSRDLALIGDADLVIEAVFEDISAKQAILAAVSATVSQECLIATNTSSLLINELGKAVTHSNRFIGVHYNNPADSNPVVEIIPGENTLPIHSEFMVEWMTSAGKLPVRCKDTPGFILNRQSLPYLNEAARCLEFAIPGEIDAVATGRLGVGLGPFAVMNLVGLPVIAAASLNLQVLGSGYQTASQLQVRSKTDSPGWEIINVDQVSKEKTSRLAKRLRGAMIFPGKDILDHDLCSRADLHRICKEALGYDKSSPELLELFEPSITNELIRTYLSHQ